jgi:uncharacterized protein (DUF302 family)
MQTTNAHRGMWKTLTKTFDEALTALPPALKEEGFGVITEIDMQATLKAKIGVDFRRYRIIGACNPKIAHEAVSGDLHMGMLLPCNVVLYEENDGKAILGVIDPVEQLGAAPGSAHEALAKDVKGRLERVLAAM